MKFLLKPAVAAGLMLVAAGPLAVAPAGAQALKTIGVVDLPYIVGKSNAYTAAEQQRPTTYKQYYDQAKTRSDQVDAQLKPMVDKLQADAKAPNADRAALQKQADTIQAIDQAAQRELQQIMAPVTLSQEYVQEQINNVLPQAVEAAAKAKGVSLILNRENIVVYREASYDMNQAVIDEVNKALPVAQLVPPPGWLPKELRDQQEAAQGGQASAQKPAAGTTPAPQPTQAAGPPVESR